MSDDDAQGVTEAETAIRGGSLKTTTGDYSGYQPLTFADLVSNQSNRAPADGVDGDVMVEDEEVRPECNFRSNGIAKSSAIVVCILLCFCLLVFIPQVACGMNLCHKYDRASAGDPGFMIFKFIFPYQFVWTLFTTAVAGILAVYVHLFMQSDNQVGCVAVTRTALHVRKVSKVALRYEFYAQIVLVFPLLVLIGFGVSWHAAACFLLGVVLAVLSGWFAVHVANYGCIRLAAEAESHLPFRDATKCIFRAAAPLVLLGMSMSVGGIGLAYLIFRNIRSILGFAAGVSTIALSSRVSSGIYSAATSAARDIVAQIEFELQNGDEDARNPLSIAARVGDYVEGAVGIGVDYFESAVCAIVACTILATCLPFVQQNAYAMCVYNHLHIDHACIAYDVATVKISFAAQICRANEYFKTFPDVFFMESNSIFVALPFMVATLGVLVTLVSSVCLFVLRLEITSDRRKNGTKLLLATRVQVALASVLFSLGLVAIAYGFFGRQSNFQRRMSRNIFPRSELKLVNASRCIPMLDQTGNIVGDNLPLLHNGLGPYRPTSVLGVQYPNITEIPWRVLLCLIMGQILGLLLHILMPFFTQPQYPLVKSVGRMAECSTEDVIIHALGTALSSTALPFMLILANVIASYVLLASYGIALSAVSMISSSGVMFMISCFDVLASAAAGAVRMNKRSMDTQDTIQDLGSIGNAFTVSFQSLCAGVSVLTSFALIAELIRMTSLVPSPVEIIGVSNADPLRHISSTDNLSIITPNVVVSVLVGVVLPFVFIALPLLGMSRTRYAIIVETRRQFGEYPQLRTSIDETLSHTKKSVRISAKYAIFEMLLPVFIILIVPQMVGFGLGQRALLGLLFGSVGCGYLVSSFVLNASTTWQNARTLIESEYFGSGTGRGSKWHEYICTADGIGSFLKRTSAQSLSIATKLMIISSIFVAPFMKPDASKWFIGLTILAIAAFVTIAILFMSHMYERRTEKIARRALVGRVEGENESEDTSEIDNVDHLPVSPFYEEGTTILRSRIAPNSAFAHARIDPSSLPAVHEHTLRNRRSHSATMEHREYLVSKRDN